MWRVGLCLLVLRLAPAGRIQAQSLPAEVIRYADIVMHGGKILTVDAQFSIAQGILLLLPAGRR